MRSLNAQTTPSLCPNLFMLPPTDPPQGMSDVVIDQARVLIRQRPLRLPRRVVQRRPDTRRTDSRIPPPHKSPHQDRLSLDHI